MSFPQVRPVFCPRGSRSGSCQNALTTPIIDMSGKKDILQYLRQLRKQGYEYCLNGNGHYEITYEGRFVTTAAKHPKGTQQGSGKPESGSPQVQPNQSHSSEEQAHSAKKGTTSARGNNRPEPGPGITRMNSHLLHACLGTGGNWIRAGRDVPQGWVPYRTT